MVSCMPLKAKCHALKRRLAAHRSPRRRLIGRCVVIGAFCIANVVQVFTNLHNDLPNQAAAFAVMSFMMVLCTGVFAKLGFKTLPEQIREYEGLADPFPVASSATATSESGSSCAYDSTSSPASPPYSPSNLDPCEAKSLTVIVTREGAEPERVAKPQYHYQQCGSTPVSVGEDIAITSDDPSHPLNACWFRRNPKPVIALCLVGLFGYIAVAIYYLVLAIKCPHQPTISTVQDTLYLCFILYLVCVKWCYITISLMVGLRKDTALCVQGTLFLVEAETKEAERLKMAEEDLKYQQYAMGESKGCPLIE